MHTYTSSTTFLSKHCKSEGEKRDDELMMIEGKKVLRSMMVHEFPSLSPILSLGLEGKFGKRREKMLSSFFPNHPFSLFFFLIRNMPFVPSGRQPDHAMLFQLTLREWLCWMDGERCSKKREGRKRRVSERFNLEPRYRLAPFHGRERKERGIVNVVVEIYLPYKQNWNVKMPCQVGKRDELEFLLFSLYNLSSLGCFEGERKKSWSDESGEPSVSVSLSLLSVCLSVTKKNLP